MHFRAISTTLLTNMGSSPLRFSAFNHHLKFVQGIFKEYFGLFGWSNRQNMKIMDIGTGGGRALFEIEHILPEDYEEIICVDKDAEMCKYFSTLKKDPRISVRQLNIGTKMLPNDLKGRFDFLMSSYCFTYVLNFRQAFMNSSELLKPGGELFFFWSKTNQLYEAYRTLSHTGKWAPYLKDFKNWRHPFDDDYAIEGLAKEFNEVGLKILKIEDIKKQYFENENSQVWLDAFSSLDMVSERIPKYEFLEYKKDLDKLILSYVVEDKLSKKTKVLFPTLVVAAKKVQ